MKCEHLHLKFYPHNREACVVAGANLLEAAAHAGLALNTPCGGNGTCGKCRVQFTIGAPDPSSAETDTLPEDEIKEGWRLGCQARVYADAEVYVPESSLIAGHHQIQETAATGEVSELQPIVYKKRVALSTPTLEDNIPDMSRLEQQTGRFVTDLNMMRKLPRLLREADFTGTAVLSEGRLIDFEQGDTSDTCYGAAFDIGTTTIVGVLMDLCTGEEKAVTSRMNPQVKHGDDVLARIRHSSSSQSSLEELQTLVVGGVNSMLEELMRECDISPHNVYDVIFAGNTTMQHLLCGFDTSQLGEIPFVPVHGRGLTLWAQDLNIPINERGVVYVFPLIGGFVGGDTVGGMLATDFPQQEGPVLMVDIGTNGEIVLLHDDTVYAASTAAGPAFEGARLACGMRATNGAVEKVIINEDIECGVIGGGKPMGICGSGLIDLVSELLDYNVLSPEGHLPRPHEVSTEVMASLRERIKVDDDGEKYFVVSANEDNEVILTQRDIRELQLATGAIRAGTEILLKRAGVRQDELKRVFIAGGFGSFIRRSQAQRIGLLPTGVDHRAITYVGNVSLSGAKWALLSKYARERAETFAQTTEHVELATDTEFQMLFTEAMIFP